MQDVTRLRLRSELQSEITEVVRTSAITLYIPVTVYESSTCPCVHYAMLPSSYPALVTDQSGFD
jgi:hypothetical protein